MKAKLRKSSSKDTTFIPGWDITNYPKPPEGTYANVQMELPAGYSDPQSYKEGSVYEDALGRKLYLESGQYMGEHGLSNHWTFRVVKPDGTLGKRIDGYGAILKNVRAVVTIKIKVW